MMVAPTSPPRSGARAHSKHLVMTASGRRGLRRWTATSAAALLVLVGHAPAAQAHYVEPPSDWNAAPAVVQIETTYSFIVSLSDPKLGLRPYRVEVAGPRGTGAIFDPSGAVITTRGAVLPDEKPARIEGVNRGFDAARPPGWITPPDMTKRQTVKDPQTNRQLQACYAAGSGCITFLGRHRTVVLNTVPATRVACNGYKEIGDGLVILPAKESRPDATPTVGIANASETPPNSPFVALGYNKALKLTRFTSKLVDGKLTDADSAQIRKTFVSDGSGVALVGPQGKGPAIGVVVPTEDGMRLVAPQAGINGAGYRPIRGALHQRIDSAIGFYNGKHYAHSVPVLEKVIETLPDAELQKMLTDARAKEGKPGDISLTDSMDPNPATAQDNGVPWAWIGVGGLLLVGAAVAAALVVRQRRANAQGETHYDDDFDDPDDYDDDDAYSSATAQEAPDSHSGAVPGSGSAMTLPVGRTDPGVAVAEADRPAEDQQSVRYCTNCGAALAAGDRFCFNCGTSAR